MKTLFAFLLLSVAVASAQNGTVTNSVKVVLSTNDDNALRLAWKLDSNARTNGLAPYGVVTNALTYGQFQDDLGTDAFQRIALIKADQNLSQVISLYRVASDADRAKVARILAGLSQ